MSRFKWLEVSKKKAEPEQASDGIAADRALDEDHYLALGDRNCENGHYETALRYYSRALNLNPKIEQAWIGQLFCLLELGEFKETITWADKTLELFPDSSSTIAIKSVAWGRLGNLEKAKGFSDAAMKYNTPNQWVWWARGDVLMAENSKNAEFCFRKAIEIDSQNWLLYLRIGLSWMSIKKNLKAKEYLLKARMLNETNAIVWFWMGMVYWELGNFNDAQDNFAQALEIDPEREEVKVALKKLQKTGGFIKFMTKIFKLFRP